MVVFVDITPWGGSGVTSAYIPMYSLAGFTQYTLNTVHNIELKYIARNIYPTG